MPGPEDALSSRPEEAPSYQRGEAVRVYVDRGGDAIPEDDWEYRTYMRENDSEVAAKNYPEDRPTQFVEIPKAEFDNWQRERAIEEAGRLTTAATVETDEAVAEVVTEETAEEAKDRPTWGRFNKEGRYELTADPSELSRLIDVPASVLMLAADMGFPPESLLSAKTNPFTAKRLREAGLPSFGEASYDHLLDDAKGPGNGGPEVSDATITPLRLSGRLPLNYRDLEELQRTSPDEASEYLSSRGLSTIAEYKAWYDDNYGPGGPKYREERDRYKADLDNHFGQVRDVQQAPEPMFFLEAKGNRKQIEVEELADKIESNPKSLKKELRRPGKLPLSLHKVPLIGPKAGRASLAWSMNLREKRERADKGLGRSHEDGLLRLGLPRFRRNLAYIRRHDEDVRVYRNKLTAWNNHEYIGPEKASARRDLAELIHRTKQRQEALSQLKVHHDDVYVHDPLKDALGNFARKKSGVA